MDTSIPQNIKAVVSEPLQQLKVNAAVVAGWCWQPCSSGDTPVLSWVNRDTGPGCGKRAFSSQLRCCSVLYLHKLFHLLLLFARHRVAQTLWSLDAFPCLYSVELGWSFALAFGLKLFGVLMSSFYANNCGSQWWALLLTVCYALSYCFSNSFPGLLWPLRQKSTVLLLGDVLTLLEHLCCYVRRWTSHSDPFFCLSAFFLAPTHVSTPTFKASCLHAGLQEEVMFPEAHIPAVPNMGHTQLFPQRCSVTLLPHWYEWRLMLSFSFLLEETLDLFYPVGTAAELICWPQKAAKYGSASPCPLSFSKLCGQFWSCSLSQMALRFSFVSVSLAHWSSIHLCVDQKDAEIHGDFL